MHSRHDSEPSIIALAEALGVGHLHPQKIVLELEVGCHPRLYLKSMMPTDECLGQGIEIVKDLFVGDDCQVTVVPHGS